tara:strand:+ start:166 stop:279 length:114 start_codon:yes stop_codon:yes gene_type:complete
MSTFATLSLCLASALIGLVAGYVLGARPDTPDDDGDF